MLKIKAREAARPQSRTFSYCLVCSDTWLTRAKYISYTQIF